jgi:hypothetical protein
MLPGEKKQLYYKNTNDRSKKSRSRDGAFLGRDDLEKAK